MLHCCSKNPDSQSEGLIAAHDFPKSCSISLNVSGSVAVYAAEVVCRHLGRPRNTKCFFCAQCVVFQAPSQGMMCGNPMQRKIISSEKTAQCIKVLT